MKETRFKQTDIGLIPEDWEVKLFSNLFTFISNNTLSRDMLDTTGVIKNIHYGDVLIKFGAILDVSIELDTYIKPIVRDKVKYQLRDGDIVIADTAEDETVGKCCEVSNTNDSIVEAGLHTMAIRSLLSFAPHFLGYSLNSSLFHNQLLSLIQGTKVSSVSKKAISTTQIAYPKSVEEQKLIADVLDDVDKLIASLERLIEKKRMVKQGTMQQLLTGKRRLPGFDKPWCTYKLSRIFEFGNGYTPSKAVKEYWQNGTIPWFRMEDIRTNGRILKDSIQKVTPLAVKGGGLFPAGSFILSTTATIGEHALLIADSLANQQFTFLWNVNRCVPYDTMFYYHYFFIIGEWCRKNINDGGLLAVNMEDLKNFECFVPSDIDEQRAIAKTLTDMDAEIAALEAKLNKYKDIKSGMMQQLLTGKIRLI